MSSPRPRVVQEALDLARVWCAGHTIDGAPALGHAVRVAYTLTGLQPDVASGVVASVILHDCPDFADLDTFVLRVVERCGLGVLSGVNEIRREHDAMSVYPDDRERALAVLSTTSTGARIAMAADKLVSIGYVLGLAGRHRDAARFWEVRGPFLVLVPYFRDFGERVGPELPHEMRHRLDLMVRSCETARSRYWAE